MPPQQITAWCVIAISLVVLYVLLERMIVGANPAAGAGQEIRARAAQAPGPGNIVVSWFSVAGVRHPDGGGFVILDRSEDDPPDWQIRGMLCDALAALNMVVRPIDYDDE